jgi:hypothetical protein
MKTGLRFVIVSAICMVPFTFPLSAMAWNALSYQEAVARCAWGDLWACAVARQYQEQAARPAGSPADRWVSPQELPNVRPGPLTTYDFVR